MHMRWSLALVNCQARKWSGSRRSTGAVRFLDSRPGATEADHGRRTDAVIGAILATGEAFIGGTTWRGKRCMCVSVCNWQTHGTDVERAVAAAGRALVQASCL